MPISKERFFIGHSVVSNKLPKDAPLADLNKMLHDDQIELEKFGLFDVAAPDFNKFYPDVKPEDLEPKDEEFSYPIFRALSKINVNKFGPIDFGKGNILKDSLSLIIGQTIYSNHESMVGNEVGAVLDAVWQNGTTQNGIKVPAGINVKLKLDGKKAPALVRGVMMSPPSVHSVSVTVTFEWNPSHKFDNVSDFYDAVGTYTDKGELVRRVVSKIVAYHEISFVAHGADPYAQRIIDGNLNNPEYASTQYKFTAEDFVNMPHYTDFKQYECIESFCTDGAGSTTPQDNKENKFSNQNKTMNKELMSFLVGILGLDVDSNEEAIGNALKDKLPGFINLQTDLDTANTSIQEYETNFPEGCRLITDEEITNLGNFEEFEGIAKSTLQATRDEAIRLQALLAGEGEVDKTLESLILSADFKTVLAFKNQFAAQVEEKFEATCQDCGGHNVERAAAGLGAEGVVLNGDDNKGGQGEETKPLTQDEAIAKAKKDASGKASGNLHVQTEQEA